MEKKYIIKSIQTQKLQLNQIEKIMYYKVSILCLFISVISFTNGFQQFTNFNFDEVLTKIGILFLIIGSISFMFKLNRLKIINVDNPNLDYKNKILSLAEKLNWEIERNDEQIIIFKTIPTRNYDNYINYNKHEGERIYIFLDHNRVLFKSIDNLDNLGFKIHKGDNLENEKVLIQTLKH